MRVVLDCSFLVDDVQHKPKMKTILGFDCESTNTDPTPQAIEPEKNMGNEQKQRVSHVETTKTATKTTLSRSGPSVPSEKFTKLKNITAKVLEVKQAEGSNITELMTRAAANDKTMLTFDITGATK